MCLITGKSLLDSAVIWRGLDNLEILSSMEMEGQGSKRKWSKTRRCLRGALVVETGGAGSLTLCSFPAPGPTAFTMLAPSLFILFLPDSVSFCSPLSGEPALAKVRNLPVAKPHGELSVFISLNTLDGSFALELRSLGFHRATPSCLSVGFVSSASSWVVLLPRVLFSVHLSP